MPLVPHFVSLFYLADLPCFTVFLRYFLCFLFLAIRLFNGSHSVSAYLLVLFSLTRSFSFPFPRSYLFLIYKFFLCLTALLANESPNYKAYFCLFNFCAFMQCRQLIERVVGGAQGCGGGRCSTCLAVWKLCQMQYYYLCFSFFHFSLFTYFCLFALHFV